jgi:hypothetical protein
MIELLARTIELLVQSFHGAVVPAAIWFWRYIVVLVVWLLVGGLCVAPLVAAGARRLYRRARRWPVRALICIAAILLIWVWLHLWTVSAVMWQGVVGLEKVTKDAVLPSLGGWAVVGVGFSLIGVVYWRLFAIGERL